MVYGDGQEFDKETGLLQYYPTLPPIVGVKGLDHTALSANQLSSEGALWL